MQYTMHIAAYYEHIMLNIGQSPEILDAWYDAWYDAWTASIPNIVIGV